MEIKQHNGDAELSILDETVILISDDKRCTCGLFVDNQPILFDILSIEETEDNKTKILRQAGNWQMEDRLQLIADDLLQVIRKWQYRGRVQTDAAFVFEMKTTFQPSFTLMPGVSYQGNWEGSGKEPKGLTYLKEPWTFSYERQSLPGATFSEDNRYCAGLYTSSEPFSLKAACNMENADTGIIHRLIWPDRETPLTYCNKDAYCDPAVRTEKICPEDEISVCFYIYLAPVKVKNFGWSGAFDRVLDLGLYKNHHQRRFTVQETWDLGIRYLKEQLWVETGAFKGFSIGLLPDGKHMKGYSRAQWRQRETRRYEIGWAGQNFSNALLLLYDYLKNGCEDSWTKGIACLDSWQQNACIGNGLFYTLFDNILEQRQVKAVDTCNLGWGAVQVLKAYELCRGKGLEKPAWLKMGIECCDFFCRQWQTSGTFGTWWSLDGKCLNRETMVGAFMVPAMIKAWQLTEKEIYRQTAIEAFMHYSRYVDNMICSGGALDTCCIDCETAVSLLEPALDLYELTGQEIFLQKAINTAYYTLSWLFHYDIHADPDSDFAQHKFRTSGASAVSTQHHHLHYGALWFLKSWIRLGHILGDQRWIKRARMVFHASQQLISDGSLVIHGMKRPAGSESEAYHQCSWGLDDNKGFKHYISDWLVVWPITFRLLNLTGDKAEIISEILNNDN